MMLHHLQGALTPDAISDVKENQPELIEQLNTPGRLVEVADSVVELAANDRAYLEAIPHALREGIRAAIASAIDADKAVHIAYTPGYDFEVRLNDYVEGISVHLKGPYPPTYPRNGYTRA
jgi:hypothetical protein